MNVIWQDYKRLYLARFPGRNLFDGAGKFCDAVFIVKDNPSLVSYECEEPKRSWDFESAIFHVKNYDMINDDDLTIPQNFRDVWFASSCRSGGGTTIVGIGTNEWTATRRINFVGLRSKR